MSTVYLISAPSGAGKTTLISHVIKNYNVNLGVSYTTRPARAGEVNGLDYHFVSLEKFNEMLADGQFFEFAEVFGNMYGTSTSEIKSNLALGHDVLLEIDWQGALKIKDIVSSVVWIFIIPPSIEALRARLLGRNSDSDLTIERRIAQARLDLSYARQADYIVVNDDFSIACQHLGAIFQADSLRCARQLSVIDAIIN